MTERSMVNGQLLMVNLGIRVARRGFALIFPLFVVAVATAQSAPASKPSASTPREMVHKGAEFLLATQDKRGGWESDKGPGISALAARALAMTPEIGPKHPAVRRAVEFVLTEQREDGGIYSARGTHKNYETSVAVSMLSALGDEAPNGALEKACQFLLDNQADEDKGISVDDVWYGGAGYELGKRPDLSNTQLMLDALKDSGLPSTDPAYQKALVFISRCQMLGEKNDQAFAKGSTSGGFIYTGAGGGESKAGTHEVNGRTELRSYGSMTYAGFKSMLFAGLKKDDARVQAALGWIREHWTLDYNPNMPEKQSREGLYYYYHTFARALAAFGEPMIRDRAGREHDWRAELAETLARQQKPDGSWHNAYDRWMEGFPALTTAYSMLALLEAEPQRSK